MKIFKSVVNDKELMIRPSGKPDYMVLGIRDSHLHGRVEMIGISREDIPSVMVSLAESVGWPEEDEYSVTHTILYDLDHVIKAQDRTTAKMQEELEAEALALKNAFHGTSRENWDSINDLSKGEWIAVVKRAREIFGR